MWCHKQAKLTIVEIGEEKELQMVMKAVVVQDGTELCTVAFWARTLLLWRKKDFDIKTSLLPSLSYMMKVTIKQIGLGATTILEWLCFDFLMTSEFKSKWGILNGASLNKVQKS